VAALCRGVGLDLNPAKEKIVKSAIGIGLEKSSHIDIQLDLSANDSLRIFSNDYFDYIFAARQLGRFTATEAALKEWWRIVKYGGYLILYEPDADYYPRFGTPGCDDSHKKDLYWQDAWKILRGFGNAKLVSASRHNDSNEYSWQLVVKKRYSLLKKPFEILVSKNTDGQLCFPRKKKTNKEVLVIRYGALGDMLWITPALAELKKDGYYVVMATTEYGAQVLKENPNVDEFLIIAQAKEIPYRELDDYWQDIANGFEKVVNFTKSIEGSLIKVEGSDEYTWSHEKRHAECNINYQDRTMELAGYPKSKGKLPEMYFTPIEKMFGNNFRKYYDDKFIVLWGLAGSAYHKAYPWSEYVAREFLTKHDDAIIITVGEELCRVLEWSNAHTINKSGMWTIRQSFLMTKYVDLVVGPDTGLLNAASCYPTPKIIFMSAGSIENLTKYWQNCTSLWAANCECYPCHKLIYSNSCPKGTIQGIAPKCMEHIKPDAVLEAMEKYYLGWKQAKAIKQNLSRFAAFTIVDDNLSHRLAKRTKNSFEYFHSDIPFYIFDVNDEERILGERRVATRMPEPFVIRPRLTSHLLKDFDGVIYLDADTVVAARLNEFLMDDYDVAGSLNIKEMGWGDDYLNAGVCAITNKQFCDEWTEAVYDKNCGSSNQPSFNKLAHSNRYRLKVVDEKDVYYNERSRKYWKHIEQRDGRLFCNNRWLKVLHWAGGQHRLEDKLSSSDFNKDTRDFLNTITQTTDFTDSREEEVSRW